MAQHSPPSPENPQAPSGATYDTLEGWRQAADEVLLKEYAPRYAVAAAGKMPVDVQPEKVAAQVVYDVAMLWMHRAPLDVRIACERAEVEENLARPPTRTNARKG